MSHRGGCAGQHPVTGEAREARAPAGDRATPGRGRASKLAAQRPAHGARRGHGPRPANFRPTDRLSR